MAEHKQINLTTRRAKQRELAAQLRMTAKIEATFAPRYRTALARNARNVGKAFSALGKRGAVSAAMGIGTAIRPILTANVATAVTAFGKHTTEAINAAQKAGNVFADATAAYIDEFGAAKVQQISETTRDRVLRVIAAGEAAGLANNEIAAQIVEKTGGSIARSRAQTIATTETHAAATFGSDAAVEATGLTVTRVWLAAEDDRTRPSHAAADGQRRAKDKPFRVGGALLDRPGDPNAPASETIRCRCVLLYEEG